MKDLEPLKKNLEVLFWSDCYHLVIIVILQNIIEAEIANQIIVEDLRLMLSQIG